MAVVVDLAKLSLGREDYYLREIAGNREECLSGHGESPRVAASRLALEGADGRVEAEGPMNRKVKQGKRSPSGTQASEPARNSD